ncbi:MAG: ECF transporter S component [Propionibacteriaceae bacterium]|jgi:energy-coupling factor transport system substrate-specific component|nr:ECF transporter S component [Propionibacteriaceae bacterium]
MTGKQTATVADDLATTSPAAGSRPSRIHWRIIDIVVAAVLGVACGFIMIVWNGPGYAAYGLLNGVTPGLGGLMQGLWLIGGPLGGLIIRKPGAAVFTVLVAAIVSMTVGNAWGVETLLFGLIEGLGAELAFAIVAYRWFSLPIAMISGALAGAGEWLAEIATGNLAKGWTYNLIYLICNAISGAILAGLLAWLLTKALARTGVLSQFAAGGAQTRARS